ncbi:hypothetical protein [Natronorubrum texcoconense]|uniref:Uncharacterized protein n=1 Tax=Natronorubrum texcoconense TaxID=1095776 RepID=A0A1G9BGP5_9EURY|nr:hypothetical protein [Natronorubrum texcoconense]SDK38689.1 hypothetical protein SAMN04515672_2952 [Natronorubrum texcoconense]
MDDQSQQLTALPDDEADALAENALETEYVGRLEAYLADEHDESMPTENVQAFERADGVRAVSFAAETDAADGTPRPDVAITIHFDDGEVVQATAERHDTDDGTVDLVFPAEIAPRPEAAVNDILQPDGQSVEVTVDESDEITVYSIAL